MLANALININKHDHNVIMVFICWFSFLLVELIFWVTRLVWQTNMQCVRKAQRESIRYSWLPITSYNWTKKIISSKTLITYYNSINGYMLLFFRIIMRTHWAWHLQLRMRWVITWVCHTMKIAACVAQTIYTIPSVSWQSVWGKQYLCKVTPSFQCTTVHF